MEKLIAICGLDCAVCPAYIAYTTNDDALRAKTAEQWAKEYGAEISPEKVNCVSCVVSEGVHIGYCFECKIRKCGLEKNVLNCAYCVEYPCAILGPFIEKVPPAKANLEAVRASLKKRTPARKSKKNPPKKK
jgi:hypothetical protein